MVPSETSVLVLLRTGTLEYAVLSLIRDTPGYGVDLARTLASFRPVAGPEGTLYPLLSRLRRNEWVTTAWRESSQGPPRRYYTVTPDGRAALAQFRHVWKHYSESMDRVMGSDGEDEHPE